MEVEQPISHWASMKRQNSPRGLQGSKSYDGRSSPASVSSDRVEPEKMYSSARNSLRRVNSEKPKVVKPEQKIMTDYSEMRKHWGGFFEKNLPHMQQAREAQWKEEQKWLTKHPIPEVYKAPPPKVIVPISYLPKPVPVEGKIQVVLKKTAPVVNVSSVSSTTVVTETSIITTGSTTTSLAATSADDRSVSVAANLNRACIKSSRRPPTMRLAQASRDFDDDSAPQVVDEPIKSTDHTALGGQGPCDEQSAIDQRDLDIHLINSEVVRETRTVLTSTTINSHRSTSETKTVVVIRSETSDSSIVETSSAIATTTNSMNTSSHLDLGTDKAPDMKNMPPLNVDIPSPTSGGSISHPMTEHSTQTPLVKSRSILRSFASNMSAALSPRSFKLRRSKPSSEGFNGSSRTTGQESCTFVTMDSPNVTPKPKKRGLFARMFKGRG